MRQGDTAKQYNAVQYKTTHDNTRHGKAVTRQGNTITYNTIQ